MRRAPAFPHPDTAGPAAPATAWEAPSATAFAPTATDEGEDDLWGAAAAPLCSDAAAGAGATGPQDPAQRLETSALLRACAAEATRLAAAMTSLDAAIAACLGPAMERAATSHRPADPGGPVAMPPVADTLQRVDLLRQELDGLARALAIATGQVACRSEIEPATVGAALPLAAQRKRLLASDA